MQTNFSEESFCPEIYNQIQIDMQGYFRVCCLSSVDAYCTDDAGNKYMVQTHSLNDVINSIQHKIARLELSQNIKPKMCSSCHRQENNNMYSRRLKFIKQSKDGTLPEYIKAEDAKHVTKEDGSIDGNHLVNLDIRFGNLCNLKCIMCDPANSSLWYEDWYHLVNTFDKNTVDHTGRIQMFKRGGIEPGTGKVQFWKSSDEVLTFSKDKHGKVKLDNDNEWWETDSWKTQFRDIAPRLRNIYFTGGEPLLVPAMEEHLQYLIDTGNSKNILLIYDTNLTAINQKIIDMWKMFKHVELRVSVDDVGERYNVVRNPGNFDKLKRNIFLVQQSGIQISRITIVCHLANIYGIIRISEFANELGIAFTFRFVTQPKWLDVISLPRSAKLEVIDTLTKESLKEKHSPHVSLFHSAIKQFNDTLDVYQPGAIKQFVKVMNTLDERRGIDWKTTLNDVSSLIERHCPDIDINYK